MTTFKTFINSFLNRLKQTRNAFMSTTTLDNGGSGFTFNLNKLTAVGIVGDNLVLVIDGIGVIRLPMTQRNFQFFIARMTEYSNLATAALFGTSGTTPSP